MERNNKTKIGKDVIESLTFAMYDDPRFIYREYIQNSADQIDIAVEKGFFSRKEEGKIEIKINREGRKISIYDDGTGVPKDSILKFLKNIAQGVKDRTKHKGFRGIGRLGGLAYCDKLIFETSYKKESVKSQLIWNAKELRKIINDRDVKEEASAVIDEITSLKTEYEKPEKRYFKVTLENVSNNILLDKNNIISYLSMVAPVPYKKGFYYDEKIYHKAKELECNIDEYNIYVNNDQIFKEYTTSIYEGEHNNKRKIDEIYDIELIEIRNSKNELISWGWYGVSSFLKQIPTVNIARGIRLRKGNIQIGDDRRLVELFKEPRGSFYFFGEIHAVNSDLIPNARRDYFVENETFKYFEKELRNIFSRLYKLYHFSSKVRNINKSIIKLKEFGKELNQKKEKGLFTNPEEEKKDQEKFEDFKEKASESEVRLKKILKNLEKSGDSSEKKIFEKVIGKEVVSVDDISVDDKNGKTRLITDKLPQFSRKNKRLVSKILAIIDEVLVKDLADNLKEKIVEKLSKTNTN